MNDLLLPREPNDLALLEDKQRALERVARVPLLRHEFADETLVARTPADRQTTADLLFDLRHLLVDRAARQPVGGARGNGIHGGELEEPDRLLDMVVLYDGRQGEFRERLGDTNDCLELTEVTGRVSET